MTARVYLAGPEVFLPDALAQGARKKELCRAYGFEGLFPLDKELGDAGSGPALALAIYGANLGLIEASDLLIANLTPFRGPSADVGTAVEVGIMAGLGRPVLGYSNDARDLLERVGPRAERGGVWRDADGLTIESFGLADNLMIDMALARAGFPLVRRAVAAEARWSDLEGFAGCLALARDAGLAAARR